MKTIESAYFDKIKGNWIMRLARGRQETDEILGEMFSKNMRKVHVQEVQDMTMYQGDNQSWSNL